MEVESKIPLSPDERRLFRVLSLSLKGMNQELEKEGWTMEVVVRRFEK
jgi:hypothetical protein